MFRMVSNTYSAASLYPSRRGTGISLLTGYLALYAVTLYAMAAWGHFAADVALGVAAVLGAGFSIGAWLLTIGVRPLTHQVWQPGTELPLCIGSWEIVRSAAQVDTGGPPVGRRRRAVSRWLDGDAG